jgi:hypothetical protein
MFSRLGGQEAGELAHRRFVLGDTSPEVMAAWLKIALPLYKQKNLDLSMPVVISPLWPVEFSPTPGSFGLSALL